MNQRERCVFTNYFSYILHNCVIIHVTFSTKPHVLGLNFLLSRSCMKYLIDFVSIQICMILYIHMYDTEIYDDIFQILK